MNISRDVIIYKGKAGLASFGVFLCFALAMSFIAYQFWYPGYLFWLDGGVQGLSLVFSVDLVLGPLMILVFFHPGKSRRMLVFDIAVAAIVQASAMVWGYYQVYTQRPAAIIYDSRAGNFVSATARILKAQKGGLDAVQKLSEARPPYVYQRPPATQQERDASTQALWGNGIAAPYQIFLYVPVKNYLDQIFARQQAFKNYLAAHFSREWQQWSRESNADDQRYALFQGRYASGIVRFSAQGNYEAFVRLPGDGSLPQELLPVAPHPPGRQRIPVSQ